MTDPTTAVRDEDAFDVDAVAAWLRDHAAGGWRDRLAGTPAVRQFPGGASNLTYLLAWPDARPIGQGQELVAAKAFHVSPFCQVTGSYRFRFFNRDGRSLARVDHHDDQGPVLLTSISGRLDPLTQRACARALLAYPVFTLGVILRIHWQALQL